LILLLATFTSYHDLVLSYNGLNSLPDGFTHLNNLTGLDLDENNLSILPEEIGHLVNLTELDLSGNKIPEEEQERIQQLLPDCIIYFEDDY